MKLPFKINHGNLTELFSPFYFLLFRRNYLLISLLIGFGAGVFAILFTYAIEIFTKIFLEGIVGYIQPKPAGEGGISESYTLVFKHPLLLPLVVGLGGLLSGLLTYFFSPYSAGVGTDAAIRAFHKEEKLSIKDSIVKLITSAITIGTGGVSGREGPIALIGAGLGSALTHYFKMGERERRIFLAVGLGAGIAAIFKAPLAGAIISGEVFFRKDFDIETTILSFIACIVAYTTYGLYFGFQPIFGATIPPHITPLHLPFYVGLGIFCALIVRFFLKIFFLIKNFFDLLQAPFFLKPLIGGIITGFIGSITPVAIGNGYGWLQLLMDGKIMDPLFVALGMLGVTFGVSFTLGSGGSGGVFGPSVMIGGLAGALYTLILNKYADFNLHLPSFMIVGMVSLFGSAAKAPLSTLLLIAEMTGGYSLLFPGMLSVFTSYYLSGKESIFPSQVETKLDSPAFKKEYGIYALEKLKVKDFMKKPITITPETPLCEAHYLMHKHLISGLPVIENGKLLGILTKTDLLEKPQEEWKNLLVKDIMTKKLITIEPEESLAKALQLMIHHGIGRLLVVDKKEKDKLIGIISRTDIGLALRKYRGE